MKVYKTQDIRNVAVLGHGGCGKTTLVEAMANVTGVTSRMGKVVDGNTISDYDKEEIKRKFSISPSFQLNGDSGRSIFLILRVISILSAKLKKHYLLLTARSLLSPVKPVLKPVQNVHGNSVRSTIFLEYSL